MNIVKYVYIKLWYSYQEKFHKERFYIVQKRIILEYIKHYKKVLKDSEEFLKNNIDNEDAYVK